MRLRELLLPLLLLPMILPALISCVRLQDSYWTTSLAQRCIPAENARRLRDCFRHPFAHAFEYAIEE